MNAAINQLINTMKLIQYKTPLAHTTSELADWVDDPLTDFFFRDLVAGDSRLAVDVFEDDENYFAQLHLPGVEKKHFSVKLEPDGSLLVSLERTTDDKTGEVTARANRRLQFSEETDADAVKGKFENGVLTLTVPKTEARIIDIV